MKKWVYLFTEGDAGMRNLLGGKGANLAEMTNLGLPVPQGFTITTEACTQYYEDGRRLMMKFRRRLWNTSVRWKRLQERNSEIKRILFLYLYVSRCACIYAGNDGHNT